jgi:hypothetical protein
MREAWLFFATAVSILAATPAIAQPTVTAAQPLQFSGRIETANRRDANGRRYQDHRVQLQAGERYRVSIMAARFDPRVQVFQPTGGAPVAENDDTGNGQNARTTFVAPQTGSYILRAGAFLASAAGAYYLRVEQARPFPPPLATERPPNAGSNTTVWQDYQGRLSAEDPSLDGLNFDDYLVSLEAGERILVQLESTEFDPYIQILSAADREDEILASDDDSAGNRNALLMFAPRRSGNYVVRVIAWGTTLTRPFVGAYRLRIGR